MECAKISRRDFIKKTTIVTALGTTVAVMQGCLSNSQRSSYTLVNGKRPNFVLIMSDDISWNDFGCYGNPYVRTPNIDQIAKNGMRLLYRKKGCKYV